LSLSLFGKNCLSSLVHWREQTTLSSHIRTGTRTDTDARTHAQDLHIY